MISDLVTLIFPESQYVVNFQEWLVQNFPDLTSLEAGAAMMPWDNILACTVLCVFIVSLFKFMRTVLTKLL